jgi:transposase
MLPSGLQIGFMPTLTELAQLGKQALLAFVAQVLTECAALKTRVEELLTELATLNARVTQLLAEIATLKAQLEQRTRDAKRQAAPFSKGQRKAQPKRPGRKPGQGLFTFRTLPRPDQWTAPPIEVRLPEPICPCCGEALHEQRVDFAAITEIPPQPRPIVQPYRVWVYRCPTCETTVRAPHPDLAPDQYGATAHRMGPRVMAAAHATH